MLFEMLHHGEPIVLKVYGTIMVGHSCESLRFCAKKIDSSLKQMILFNNVFLYIVGSLLYIESLRS